MSEHSRVEVEVSPGTWVLFDAACSCGGMVKRITEGETLSLGPGHQSQPLITGRCYECADCGERLVEVTEETP